MLLFHSWSSTRRKRELIQKQIEQHELNALSELEGIYTDKALTPNLNFIKKILGNSNDLVIHPFISSFHNIPAAVVYIDGLVKRTLINEQILGTLLSQFRMFNSFDKQRTKLEEIFQYQLVSMSGIKTSNEWEFIILSILSGDTALLINGTDQALVISTRAWEARGIEEPVSEGSIRGPHEGFTETLRTNTALIRRKIRDPFLWMEQMNIGLRSQTEVIVAYIEGLTNPSWLLRLKED